MDCLAQGVKYFTDALASAAQEEGKLRKRDDWNQMMEEWLDDPQAAANHMAFGMGLDQRRQSNLLSGKKSVHTWV